MDIIQGIELGESGVIIKYKTWEEFCPIEDFRHYIIVRRGCFITLQHKQFDIKEEFFFHEVKDNTTDLRSLRAYLGETEVELPFLSLQSEINKFKNLAL